MASLIQTFAGLTSRISLANGFSCGSSDSPGPPPSLLSAVHGRLGGHSKPSVNTTIRSQCSAQTPLSGRQPRGMCAVEATPAPRAAPSDRDARVRPPGLSRGSTGGGKTERGGRHTGSQGTRLRSPVSHPRPVSPLHGPRGHAAHTVRSLVLPRQPELDLVPDTEEDRGLPEPLLHGPGPRLDLHGLQPRGRCQLTGGSRAT